MHGIQDAIVPMNKKKAAGKGPKGSLMSQGQMYYENKKKILKKWAKAMKCGKKEKSYPTPYDGEDKFKCFERKCKNDHSIVRCSGKFTHVYPLSPSANSDKATELAYQFMKNHPRKS